MKSLEDMVLNTENAVSVKARKIIQRRENDEVFRSLEYLRENDEHMFMIEYLSRVTNKVWIGDCNYLVPRYIIIDEEDIIDTITCIINKQGKNLSFWYEVKIPLCVIDMVLSLGLNLPPMPEKYKKIYENMPCIDKIEMVTNNK